MKPNFELINYFLQNANLIDKVQLITLMASELFIPTPKVHEDGTKWISNTIAHYRFCRNKRKTK